MADVTNFCPNCEGYAGEIAALKAEITNLMPIADAYSHMQTRAERAEAERGREEAKYHQTVTGLQDLLKAERSAEAVAFGFGALIAKTSKVLSREIEVAKDNAERYFIEAKEQRERAERAEAELAELRAKCEAWSDAHDGMVEREARLRGALREIEAKRECTRWHAAIATRALTQARQEERERCAGIAEQHEAFQGAHPEYREGYRNAALDIAAAIRAGEGRGA